MTLRKKTVVMCALVALTGLLGIAAHAETSAEALEVLEKVKALEGKPFRASYSADMEIEQFGSKMSIKMNGEMTQGGEKLQHNKVSMSMEGVPGMPGPMEMDMLSVLDGENIWIDMTHPMMGRQVMKIALDKADALAKMGGGMTPGNNAGSNPLSQIQDMTEVFDFEILERKDGAVTLQAEFTDEAAAKLGEELPPIPGGTVIKLIVDERSGVPRQMSLGEVMTMRFSDFTLLAADDVDSSLFVFEKPEGVPVMDLGAMANTLSGAGAEAP